MDQAVVILSVLFTTSATMCVAMTLAWLHFGRQRHALSWALAFGGGAVQWIVNAAAVGVFQGHPVPMIAAGALVIVTSTLVAIGCRQRAGLPDRKALFWSGAAAAIFLVGLSFTVIPYFGLRGAVTNIYAAAMMPIGAAAIWPRRRKAEAQEIAFVAALLIFWVYQTALGAVGLAIGPTPDPEGLQRYRMMLAIGLPPVYVGVGVSAVFLVAGDLATAMRALVTRDPLTGCFNRRGIEQSATALIAAARRHGRDFSVVVGDIDRFKAINDRFGHFVGDRALVAFADHVHASVREEDLLGRIGGDEFCILMVDAGAREAAEAVERIRTDMAALRIEGLNGTPLTASFGIASFAADDLSFSDLLQRADLALYDSKIGGRNRTTIADAGPEKVSGRAVR